MQYTLEVYKMNTWIGLGFLVFVLKLGVFWISLGIPSDSLRYPKDSIEGYKALNTLAGNKEWSISMNDMLHKDTSVHNKSFNLALRGVGQSYKIRYSYYHIHKIYTFSYYKCVHYWDLK